MASTGNVENLLGEQLSLLPGFEKKISFQFDPGIEAVAYKMAGPRPIDLVCKTILAAHEVGIPFTVKTVIENKEIRAGNRRFVTLFKYEIEMGELEDRRDEG